MRGPTLGIYRPAHKAVLVLSDFSLLALAFYCATMLRLGYPPDFLSIEYIGINAILSICLFVSGAYSSSGLAQQPKLPLRTFFVVLTGGALSLLFIYLLGPERYTAILGRGVFPFAIISFGIAAVLSRPIINFSANSANQGQKIFFLGRKDSFERLFKSISAANTNVVLTPILNISELAKMGEKPTAIVICPEYKPDKEDQSKLLKLRLSGVIIFSLSDFCEGFLFLVPVQDIDNDWFIRAEGFTMLHNFVTNRVKRGVDILAAALLLLITFPIVLLACLMVRLTSQGPLLFSQTRVGIEGREFTLYKLRTMRVGAELEGAQWASPDDPRILPMGVFLRRTRIDELPQCWNILKGDMSIIGPRPERPEFTKSLANEIPYYDLRHVIKPGLTGWAQVSYPYGASVEDALKKLQYDLYYIKNHSLLLDLNILMRTVLVTLRRSGR